MCPDTFPDTKNRILSAKLFYPDSGILSKRGNGQLRLVRTNQICPIFSWFFSVLSGQISICRSKMSEKEKKCPSDYDGPNFTNMKWFLTCKERIELSLVDPRIKLFYYSRIYWGKLKVCTKIKKMKNLSGHMSSQS